MKIGICIPTNRQVRPLTVLSLLEMVADSSFKLEIILATGGVSISEHRSFGALIAQKKECDYILFVDDDMVFPHDTLNRLLKVNKDVVGVAANQKVLPLKTTVELRFDKEMPSKPFRAKSVGTGIILIKMDVFDRIKKPWFYTEFDLNGRMKMGQDIWFCRRIEDQYIEIWCDPTISVKHIGDYLF